MRVGRQPFSGMGSLVPVTDREWGPFPPSLPALPAQELSLCLAFDYAEHDMYEVIRFHRDQGVPIPPYTIKSLVYQLLQGEHAVAACYMEEALTRLDWARTR